MNNHIIFDHFIDFYRFLFLFSLLLSFLYIFWKFLV